ncbi:MAG: CBS domain-containing protein [Thermoanaerobaculia bacterium]
MYVRDLMTPHVISVKPTDTLGIAREQLRENRIHHLVVLDDEKVVGLVSYRDLIGKNDSQSVAQIMSPDFETCEPWETVRNAATRMIGRTHGCLPVMESGKVAGVITTTDLLRAVSHAKTA